jgi:multidrug resistance efflux pump
MARLERRIFRLNDEIRRLEAELRQARAELDNHRSLADDAARDAALYDTPYDREDLRETNSDVDRFERLVSHFEAAVAKAIEKRDRLLEKLDGRSA